MASSIRRFVLNRLVDATGISGTGVVAEGVVLPTGRVVMEWRPPATSMAVHNSIEDLLTIHGHGGNTQLVWVDG